MQRKGASPSSPAWRRWYLPAAVFAAFIFLAAAASAAEITVSAAASLTDALKTIGANYERQAGDRVLFNFGGSSTLARQIQAGAPVDLFFSADEAQMDRLAHDGLIDPATRRDLLGNHLVIVVATNSPLSIHSAADLTNADVDRIALADPKGVPAGVYAKEWLAREKVWTAVAPKVVPMENVRGALAAVESENVAAGIVYRTDAAISSRVKIACEVPAAEAPAIHYPVAVVKTSAQPVAARKFLDYLQSAAAENVFRRFGFILHER